MGINVPESATEIDQRSKTDVQRVLAESNPHLKNSMLGALITGYSNRIFDFYLQMEIAQLAAFADTAEGEDLERIAAIYGKTRLAATQSAGDIVATGTATTVIPNGTTFASSDGLVYTSTADATIIATVLNITSITRSGSTATVVTASDHNIASNVEATIAGAVETEYNGAQAIQVTGPDSFTFQVSGTPTTPATGTITVSFTSINVPVTSNEFGAIQNQSLDAVISVQSPISGLDTDLNVYYGGLTGGADQEDDSGLRLRLLDRLQNPTAHFSVDDIIQKAKEVQGVTRVFVQEITPANGQVAIYFMRDGETNPIPTASNVTTTKNKILEIKPANTADADVIVAAPTGVSTNYIFSSLTPNTATMKSAVTASLEQFYAENTEVGVNVDEDAFRSAIYNTIDTVTGQTVTAFTLTAPATDIVIASGEIGLLGSITYP